MAGRPDALRDLLGTLELFVCLRAMAVNKLLETGSVQKGDQRRVLVVNRSAAAIACGDRAVGQFSLGGFGASGGIAISSATRTPSISQLQGLRGPLEALDVLCEQSDHLFVLSAPSTLGGIGIATENRSTAHRAALLGGVPSLFHHVEQGALPLDAGIGDLDSDSQLLPGGSDTEQRTALVVTAMHQPLALIDQLGDHGEMAWGGLKHLLRQPWV
jgi:hypothetical protein